MKNYEICLLKWMNILMSKLHWIHNSEKKNKANKNRYQHLLRVIDADYEIELKQIINEGISRDENQDRFIK